MRLSLQSLSVLTASALLATAALGAPRAVEHARIAGAYGKLPLVFEANRGQADPEVRFLSRGQGYSVFFTQREAIVKLDGAAVRWRLSGANATPRIAGEEPLATKTNYFHGNDASQWHTGVPNYGRVRYESVYPGIDLLYHGNRQRLEYDFVLAPGANARQIRMAFDGARALHLAPNGDLVLQTAAGDLVQPRPDVYQDIDGHRRRIDGRYTLDAHRQVGFAIGRHDRNQPLVIDPTIAYSTYLGDSAADEGLSIAVDGDGNAYLTGLVESTSFTGVSGGSLQPANGGDYDAFVTKINAAGTAIVYSTFLGGSGTDYGQGIGVDGSGNAYVAGGTTGSFPGVSGGSYQPSYGGGTRDAFLTALDSTGSSILWSTYLGGSADDVAQELAVTSSGDAYVAGSTASSDFPVLNAVQSSIGGNGDAFVARVGSTGTVAWATYLGDSGDEVANMVAVDGSGNAYVTGQTDSTSFPGVSGGSIQSANGGGLDAFVTKINAAGSSIVYSTFLGDSGMDVGNGIAVDGSGNAVVVGNTDSTSFPGVSGGSLQPANAGSLDIFVTKLNAAGSAISWSTFLGDADIDATFVGCVGVDGSGNVYIVGSTLSTSFPGVSGGSIQSANAGGIDAFFTELNAAGSAIVQSTFLGDTGDDFGVRIAVDGSGAAYLTGWTSSTSFPGTSGSSIQNTYGGGDVDAFVTKITNP
ncbi:MAG: SBBP repeat-containing protein [Acidobacteria bacterium]|nr:SBBP repeat-containing protein [Acidobacteriota bacterium]MBV9476804.1 SBBP repeat-containing protein [Acidobacteriota bacterium]